MEHHDIASGVPYKRASMLIVVEHIETAPILYGLSCMRKYHFTGEHHDFIRGSR